MVAHPHDFTHCAGTCGIHTARGDSVTVVTMTDGGKTHNEKLFDELRKPEAERNLAVINQSEAEYVEKKAAEIRNVCSVFGVEDVRIQSWNQPLRLEQSPGAVEALRQVFYEVRPHVLITQKPYYSGRNGMAFMARDDHNETAIAVIEARGLAGLPDAEAGISPHITAATYFMGVYFMPDEMDFYVDISDWHEKRVEAEILFESQGHFETFARRRVEIGAGQCGWTAGTNYAEGFVRERPNLMTCLELSDLERRRADEPRGDYMKRIGGIKV